MQLHRRLVFSLLFLLFCSGAAQAASRVEYILDVSGSMNALTAGEKRIDAAKKSIGSMVQGIPDGSIVALRLYSHRIAPSDKAASCKDTELVIPFGPINKTQVLSVVNAANPLGQTPIAYSLEQAANDFVMGADEQQTIILVSDGEESCGGDPVAVAKALIAKGFKLKINVIGLDVDAAAKNQLSAIASATGGQYFDAKDAAGLTSSLQKLTQESLVIQKQGASIYGEEIRGGDNYETAVPLPVGKLYRLNHHQRQNQYDFFYVEAKPGQKLTLAVETGEKGVSIKPDNTYEETLSPYAGIGLHSPLKTDIKREEIIGGKNDAKQIIFPIPAGGEGKYYVLIGSAYDAQHKDHRFKVDLSEQFDAGTKQDAGETRDTAITLPAGTHTIKGYLNPNDQIDTYKLPLPTGTINMQMRPSSEKARVQIQLFDADGVEVFSQMAPNDGALLRVENIALSKPGEYIVKAMSPYQGVPETEYTLEITQASGAPLAPGADAGAPPVPTTPSVPVTPTVPPAGTAPAATAPAAPTTVVTTSTATVKSSKELCSLIKGFTFFEKVKFYGLFCGVPLLAGLLFGWIFGYFKGRSSGKRWAARQAAKQATAPHPPQK